jgi:hypothetical protein
MQARELANPLGIGQFDNLTDEQITRAKLAEFA